MVSVEYAAGFFDGEGCIHIARTIRVILGGCFQPDLLKRFSIRWGGAPVAQLYKRKGKARPTVRWELTGSKAAAFLNDVLPHLIEKREQAEVALRYYNYQTSLKVRGGKGYTSDQRLLLDTLAKELKGLKRELHWYS